MKSIGRWGVMWRSDNKLGGKTQHLICNKAMPALFHTRKKAREFIEEQYGYLRTREDLCREPHGWKMPVAIRVTVAALKQ